MRLCVVGLGRVGLPVAVQCATRGHEVAGADIDPRVVRAVQAGTAPVRGEPGLDAALATCVARRSLRATVDTSAAVAAAEAVLVVVPLAVRDDLSPDFSSLDAATAAIAAGLRPGTLVSYETTLPVGTTRHRLAPMLTAGSGLGAGDGVHVVHSPERVSAGRVLADLRRYPKLVGGLDGAGARRAVELYEAVLDFDDRPDLGRPNGVWDLGSAEAAELAKLAETAYRDVNIGLANQFARYAQRIGVDVHAVIEAANSQPFSAIHRPGAAVGGHCIPVYPHLYLHGDPEATIVRAARAANASQPAHMVGILDGLLGGLAGLRVAVLGAAYRGDIPELSHSGVFPMVAALAAAGARPAVHDPLVSDADLSARGLVPYHLGEEVEAAIVHTDHRAYRDLAPRALPGIRALVDGRNVTRAELWAGVRRRVFGTG